MLSIWSVKSQAPAYLTSVHTFDFKDFKDFLLKSQKIPENPRKSQKIFTNPKYIYNMSF
jgi:hypothetical protein